MNVVREPELYPGQVSLNLLGKAILSVLSLMRLGGQLFSCLPWIILYFLGFRPLDEE